MTVDHTPRIVTVQLQTRCDATPETVWESLVAGIDDWWGEPYISSPERISLTLDPRVGGLLFEDWGSGNGTIWATVSTVRRPYRIELDGTFMMPGAFHGNVAIGIDADPTHPAQSQIGLTHRAIGDITDDTIALWEGGWHELIASLAQHATVAEHATSEEAT